MAIKLETTEIEELKFDYDENTDHSYGWQDW
jgi:hypothetical protein